MEGGEDIEEAGMEEEESRGSDSRNEIFMTILLVLFSSAGKEEQGLHGDGEFVEDEDGEEG